jgi:putative ATP-dependent endonuclease of OLD family
MRLRTVRIENYRCLDSVTLDLAGLTAFVEPNSAGKSSILHALEFFFEGSDLEPADIFGGSEQMVAVECIFDELGDADREALGPYATGDQVVLRRTWKPGGEQKLTGRGRRFSGFADIRASTGRAHGCI